MEMAVVVLHAAALVDEEPERNVERLFPGAADPEVAVALFVHGDEALLEDARAHHQIVDAEEQLGGELSVGRPRHGAKAGAHIGLHLGAAFYNKNARTGEHRERQFHDAARRLQPCAGSPSTAAPPAPLEPCVTGCFSGDLSAGFWVAFSAGGGCERGAATSI